MSRWRSRSAAHSVPLADLGAGPMLGDEAVDHLVGAILSSVRCAVGPLLDHRLDLGLAGDRQLVDLAYGHAVGGSDGDPVFEQYVVGLVREVPLP